MTSQKGPHYLNQTAKPFVLTRNKIMQDPIVQKTAQQQKIQNVTQEWIEVYKKSKVNNLRKQTTQKKILHNVSNQCSVLENYNINDKEEDTEVKVVPNKSKKIRMRTRNI